MTGSCAPCPPTDGQARELLHIAKLGARACGALGPDVDDVAQAVAETLTRKWNEPHVVAARARGRKGWHAYIAVAARNARLDLLRKRGRERRRQVSYARQTVGDALPDRPGVRRRRPTEPSNVDRFLGRQLLVDLVVECPLTPRQQTVGILTLVDGLTSAEIADMLGISVHAVNTHRRAVVRALREALLDGR